MSEIARRVRAARAYADLTLEQLAARIEVSRDTVLRTENEQRREIKQSELNAIAEACGVPRSWFSVPFEWLGEGEVVSVDLRIPDDLRVQPRLDVDLGELLADFAASISVKSVQAPPRAFSRTAYAVLERSGRLFWWTTRETTVVFHFTRPMPGGGPHRVDPTDEQLVRVVALGDLLEAWLATTVWSRDTARRLSDDRSASPGDPEGQGAASDLAEEMGTLVEDVRAAVESIVQAVISEAGESNG